MRHPQLGALVQGRGDVSGATFLGFTAEGWTALSTVFLAAATCVLVGVGVFQIRSIREEAKRSRTLAACDRYDQDIVLDGSLHRLAEARRSGQFSANPSAYRTDIATLLNYLDSIACGIAQGLYIEELARDHIEPILKGHVNQYLGQNSPTIEGIDPADYTRLTSLFQQWQAPSTRFRYTAKWRFWRSS
jgi:hypothetical protein